MPDPLSAREWIRVLNLQSHPEGGWFAEVHRSGEGLAAARAIRGIAAVVQEFAFLFARRALFRWCVGFQFISAIATFPIGHGNHLLYPRGPQADFQCP